MAEDYSYIGEELMSFMHVKKWKRYFSKQLKPHIKGKVLEVGAGIGANTRYLHNESVTAWLMLEPDNHMANGLESAVQKKEYPPNCRAKQGTLADLTMKFDSIIYIDVLEHIQEDRMELARAYELLEPGGKLLILAPAFQSLYSPFDKAIGHYRRYNKKMLKAIEPAGLNRISLRYYDSMGYFASLMNRLFLRQKYPTIRQVRTWDNFMVPVSRLTDKIFFHSFGKSIIGVWQKLPHSMK